MGCAKALLQVSELSVKLGNPPQMAVENLSFALHAGEILGIAGESGSGKSVSALALTRLLPVDANPVVRGCVRLLGEPDNLLRLSNRRLRGIRQHRIAYVFQEPGSSFNPVLSVGHQLREVFRQAGTPKQKIAAAVGNALAAVGIAADATTLAALPAAFSGGMLQRLAIACALAAKPEILVADEPTTALDATTSRRIIELLLELHRRHHMAMLLISHDLGLLNWICHRMIVLHHGSCVESGPPTQVLHAPQHPYTRRLVAAIPRIPPTDCQMPLAAPAQNAFGPT